MKKLLTIIFILQNSYLFCQIDLGKQLSLADSLFFSENYFDAIKEYKRLIFFDKESKFRFIANMQIGYSYKAGGKYDEAINYFSLAEYRTDNNDEKLSVQIEKIKINLLRGTIPEAKMLNDKLLKFSEEHTLYNYWSGWISIFEDDWENASEYFRETNNSDFLAKFCDSVASEKYSVSFTRIISYILPGFGHFYTGNFIPGLLSLSWNIFAGYLTIDAIMSERIFDALITGNFLWLRFYRGGAESAEKSALISNYYIANNALKYLYSNYKGEKP